MPYLYATRTPNTGINLYSWSFDITSDNPQGYANLSRIDDFQTIYNLHHMIGENYPVDIINMTSSYNILRFMSGMCGKAWH